MNEDCLEYKWYYLIGVYFGDGHVDYHDGGYQFIVTAEDKDLCTNCAVICDDLINKSGRVTRVDNYHKLVVC